MKGYVDNLTQLYNMLYLHENYHDYLRKNKYSYVVSIDFRRLKYINDNYGHEAGDTCLIAFSEIVKEVFLNSLLIRRSGDEFIIITSESRNVIVDKIYVVMNKISKKHKEGIVPIVFSFNAGIKTCDFDLKETLFKADITMYYAKRNNKIIEFYNDDLLVDIKNREGLLARMDGLIENKNFVHMAQPIYNVSGENILNNQFYIYDSNGESIFGGEHYELLKDNFRMSRIDIVNLQLLFKDVLPKLSKDVQLIVNIHHQTLLSIENDIVTLIERLAKENNVNFNNLCLAINMPEYNELLSELVYKLLELKKLGVKVCVNQLVINSCNSLLGLLSMTEIDYVNVSRKSLVKAMNERKYNVVLRTLINLMFELNTTPIFTAVETSHECQFISDLNKNCLIRGRIYSEIIPIEKML